MALKPPEPEEPIEPVKPPVIRIYERLKEVAEILFGWLFK